MRSMLQLVGGVAVAGAVAAGSTAFTAAGMVKAAGTATVIAGGTVSYTPTIVGGSLKTITLTNGTTGRYSAAVLTVTGDDGTTPIVSGTVQITVTDGGTGTSAAVGCTYGSSVWTCTPGTAWDSSITNIAVSVSNAGF